MQAVSHKGAALVKGEEEKNFLAQLAESGCSRVLQCLSLVQSIKPSKTRYYWRARIES